MASFSIADLHPNAINFNITGTIINKSNMSRFERKGQDSFGGVIKFVIRDSKDHFINLTVWGSDLFIGEYKSTFTIGHVVNVVKSKISVILDNEIFLPITSSPFLLTINEGFGLIEFYNGDIEGYVKLLNIPLKSPTLALNLVDIADIPSAQESGGLVDLMVVVAKLRPARQTSTEKNVRDIIVIDQTIPGMILTLWNDAWIDRSDSWQEMTTILHLINVSYQYSDYHKTTVLVARSRTLLIVDPESERSTQLVQFAKNSSLNFSDFDTSVDLMAITTIMTAKQIFDRIQEGSTAASDAVFYCVTYAMINRMDIDGYSQFYSRQCIHCQGGIRLPEISCNKENCSILYAENPLVAHYTNYFNIPLHLTDHTGTLKECRLIGDSAERILGLTLGSFLKLSDVQRSSIKWTFLLERCKVKLSIKRKTVLRRNPLISILDIQIADPTEVAEKIKIY